MSNLNPQADELNKLFDAQSPLISRLLSNRGKEIFYPKEGILKQSADAKGTQYNATIGMVKMDEGSPARLPSIGKNIDLSETDSVTYAPSAGKDELRDAWKELLYIKNPSLSGKEISKPISTAGLTHGLTLMGYLFLDPGEEIIIHDKFWGNYRLVFEKGYNAHFNAYKMFDGEKFNTSALDDALSKSEGKVVVLMNFPNNPTGYTPTDEEVNEILNILYQHAQTGKDILVILDDAYFGLVYEEGVYTQSLFAELADLHENILVAKVDGGSKEDYILGFRTGFITFGTKTMNPEIASALELKCSGAVRGTISSAPNVSQSLLLKAIESPTYWKEKEEIFEILKRRYQKAHKVLEDNKYKEYFTLLPNNSGYFMCLKLDEALDGEEVRQMLLNEYSTGVIAMGSLLRLAFSSVPESQIETLFENIYKACEKINSNEETGIMNNDMNLKIDHLMRKHPNHLPNPSKWSMIEYSLERNEGIATQTGALATWNPPISTGRSPKDTYLVQQLPSSNDIDWTSPNNIPLEPSTFRMLVDDMLGVLSEKETLISVDRVIGADPKYALPVRVIGDSYMTMAFVDNMFKEVPENIEESLFYEKPFTILVLPYDKVDRNKYISRLREVSEAVPSDLVIATDLENRIGIVYGSEYCGSVKKLMFTVMNYILPEEGILPLHCSANEGDDGKTAVLLGLSGTGKTTLSADKDRKLIGDDEHGWSDEGLANFENGSYAKLIHLDPQKEPDIYEAVFTKRSTVRNGVIIENAMVYPDGSIDLDDDRLTPNSRASFPIRYLPNIKDGSMGDHPSAIIFLTADANGVIPPVAKLTRDQAMLWFLMGYTSKLAGTEAGVKEPQTVFSRFFGEPFMPRNPSNYTKLLGMKIDQHKTKVYLVNTGWSGGPYGVGERMDIMVTRAIVRSILDGSIENATFSENEDFHILVPDNVPGVESNILDPISTWEDKDAYRERVEKLTKEFSKHFDKAYGDSVEGSIRDQCPGK